MFSTLKDRLRDRQRQRESAADDSYETLLQDAVDGKIGGSAKDLQHVEGILEGCGKSVEDFESDVAKARECADLESVSATETELRKQSRALRDQRAALEAEWSKREGEHNRKIAELDQQLVRLASQIAAAQAATTDLRRRFPGSVGAQRSQLQRDRRRVQSRIDASKRALKIKQGRVSNAAHLLMDHKDSLQQEHPIGLGQERHRGPRLEQQHQQCCAERDEAEREVKAAEAELRSCDKALSELTAV